MESFRRPRPYYPLLFFIIIFCVSCSKKQSTVNRAYYYWQSEYYLTPDVIKFIDQHSIRKLYMRILDIDWSASQGAIPVASNQAEYLNHQLKSDSMTVEIVPVVFITNKTLENIDPYDLPLLAKRLIRRCLPSYDKEDIEYETRHNFQSFSGALRVREIQFDCDWTVKTAPVYFRLLKEIKILLPSDNIKLSATIRLHQYKYPAKTGVPPVDRGMLMVYNISNPNQYGKTNSIFDMNKAKPYFASTPKYPLPLDMALPAWSWCLVYRDKKFYQIENGLDEKDLKELSFLKSKGDHLYDVIKDTVYRDLFLRPGDEIRAEGIDEHTMHQVASLAKKAVNTDDFTVSFFELSEKEIKNYSDETIDEIYTSFQ